MELDDIDYLAGSVQVSVAQIARHFSVDHVTLHLFRGGSDAENKPYVRTNYPDAWISRYLLNDYVRIDPVLQMAKGVTGPFCWSAIRLEAEHEEMMAHAAKHGVSPFGFSVVHIDDIGRRSVLSFNSENVEGRSESVV